MKVLTFGTCRLLCLFDRKINKYDLESLHYFNWGQQGGNNCITSTHDCYQVLFLLKKIYNKELFIEPIPKLVTDNILMLRNCDFRTNYLSHVKKYNINESIANIYNSLNEIEYLIIEISTIKSLIINGIPLFLDVNDKNKFKKLSEKEFEKSIQDLIDFIKIKNNNMKIIFISHFISFKGNLIPDRVFILENLKKICLKNENTYVLCPNDFINDNIDLKDDRHYRFESQYKMLDAIWNFIKKFN